MTIFIVDDDTAVGDSLKLLFELEGFAVEDFASGTEFMIGRRPREGDCVILDIQMPGLTGLDVLAQLRREGSKSPIIIYTSMPGRESTRRAYSDGAFRVLDKAFDNGLLLGVVQEAQQEADKPPLVG